MIRTGQPSGQRTGHNSLDASRKIPYFQGIHGILVAQKLAKKPTRTAPGPNPPDRGETTSAMEPMLVSESSRHRSRLNELVFELTTAATAFKASLPEGMVDALCDLVRSMNCYYSNLIEGHNTHPIDIERARSCTLVWGWNEGVSGAIQGNTTHDTIARHWRNQMSTIATQFFSDAYE
jgi:hypothetical protein